MCNRLIKDFRKGISWAAVLCCTVIQMSPPVEASDVTVLDQDRSIYVGYNASSGLPVIISAPHGGYIYPDSIPDRDAGCWNNDTQQCIWTHVCGTKDMSKCRAVTVDDDFTQDMAGELRARLCDLFGGSCPAVVFNLLGRTKFDANRDRNEATFGVEEVVGAFDDYHSLIEKEMTTMRGVGLFIDIHGHGHPAQRAELGYLVRGNDLDTGDPIDPNITSIRNLAHNVPLDFDDLLRGTDSFGGMLGEFGFDSVPSPKYRGPGKLVYFNGGYNTRRHGSVVRGSFDAIQIESARSHRDPDVRPRYVQALACTIKRFYCLYYHRGSIGADVNTEDAVGVERSSHRLAKACDAHPDFACGASRASDVNCSKMVIACNAYLATIIVMVLYRIGNR